jgi:hypothetical protein
VVERLTRTIGAPASVVWRALTEPADVVEWAGVAPWRVPADYPKVGQRALWLDRGVLLHDVITRVEVERALGARLHWGPWFVVEEYVLSSAGRSRTRLIGTWRGHPALTGNVAAMDRLKLWCEEHYRSG